VRKKEEDTRRRRRERDFPEEDSKANIDKPQQMSKEGRRGYYQLVRARIREGRAAHRPLREALEEKEGKGVAGRS